MYRLYIHHERQKLEEDFAGIVSLLRWCCLGGACSASSFEPEM